MKILKALAFFGCILLSLNLAAQDGPPPGGDAPDGGGGGGAAMPATKTYIVEQFFADIDANKDGYMTAQEMDAVGMTDRFFTFCDPDGDEKISLKEMEECALPEFVDMDSDGELTVKEVVSYESTEKGKTRGPGEEPAP